MNAANLIKILQSMPQDAEIVNEQNQPLNFVLKQTIGNSITITHETPQRLCASCGDYVYTETYLDYSFICPTCDENKYTFETTPLKEGIKPTEPTVSTPLKLHILFGADAIKDMEFHEEENNDITDEMQTISHEVLFDTDAEMTAYIKGCMDSDGYLEYRILTEEEYTKIQNYIS